MPADPRRRSEMLEWVFAALNSVEMASLPRSIFQFSGDTGDTPAWKRLYGFLKSRLQHMEPILAGSEWLAGTFTGSKSTISRYLKEQEGAERPAIELRDRIGNALKAIVESLLDQVMEEGSETLTLAQAQFDEQVRALEERNLSATL